MNGSLPDGGASLNDYIISVNVNQTEKIYVQKQYVLSS